MLDAAAETFAKAAAVPTPELLARLHGIAEALPGCGSPEQLEAIAGALPREKGE